ncbi:MAG: pyridoxamine 5'-phosphate oxidase [Ignavibacteria bacterium]
MNPPEYFLSENSIDKNPFNQFSSWYNLALESNFIHPDAMTLATSSIQGKPSARIVLLKGFDEKGFIFYTNFLSRKGKELTENPFASLSFYWDKIDKQVRIEGTVRKVALTESEEYFHSRPRGSQLGALVSAQSSVIGSREVMENVYKELEKKYAGKEIPLPDNWGGFILMPDCFEFWQSRENRLHDRIRYSRTSSVWKIERLAP